MSSRHLMEILYLDYVNTDINGVYLVTDKEDRPLKDDTSEFNFKDMLDGYYSFIDGTEIPIERADILENIQSLKELEKTDEEKEGFRIFLDTYKIVIDKLVAISDGFTYNEEVINPEYVLSGPPFGTNALEVFRKSQSLTGFGSALNFLKNRRYKDFVAIQNDVSQLNLEKSTPQEFFYLLNKHFDYIRNKSKKVGHDQRFYFKVFFQTVFDAESDGYQKLDFASEQAYKRVKEKLED